MKLVNIKFKILVLLFVFVQGGVIILFLLGTASDKPQQKTTEKQTSVGLLIVEPSMIDFGEVSESIVTGKAELINHSTETVVLKYAVPDCRSCTEVELPQQDILSGQRIPLEFQIDMTGKSGNVNNDITVMYEIKGKDYISNFVISTIAKVLPKDIESS
jgi:hypothetical protein